MELFAEAILYLTEFHPDTWAKALPWIPDETA